MGYIYIVISVIAFYAAIHRFTELDMKSKLLGALGFLLIVLAIVWFESRSDKAREQVLNLSFAFEQGKTLLCEDTIEVNKINYNYSIGGHSFLGKIDTPVQGKIIPIETCKIKE